MGAAEFARSNQPMLFTQILSLLDILRPYLFVKNPVRKFFILKSLRILKFKSLRIAFNDYWIIGKKCS